MREAERRFAMGNWGLPPGNGAPMALVVPSAVAAAWNVVLYPDALGFWDHVSLRNVEPFDFDPRLFPENTPRELS